MAWIVVKFLIRKSEGRKLLPSPTAASMHSEFKKEKREKGRSKGESFSLVRIIQRREGECSGISSRRMTEGNSNRSK